MSGRSELRSAPSERCHTLYLFGQKYKYFQAQDRELKVLDLNLCGNWNASDNSELLAIGAVSTRGSEALIAPPSNRDFPRALRPVEGAQKKWRDTPFDLPFNISDSIMYTAYQEYSFLFIIDCHSSLASFDTGMSRTRFELMFRAVFECLVGLTRKMRFTANGCAMDFVPDVLLNIVAVGNCAEEFVVITQGTLLSSCTSGDTLLPEFAEEIHKALAAFENQVAWGAKRKKDAHVHTLSDTVRTGLHSMKNAYQDSCANIVLFTDGTSMDIEPAYYNNLQMSMMHFDMPLLIVNVGNKDPGVSTVVGRLADNTMLEFFAQSTGGRMVFAEDIEHLSEVGKRGIFVGSYLQEMMFLRENKAFRSDSSEWEPWRLASEGGSTLVYELAKERTFTRVDIRQIIATRISEGFTFYEPLDQPSDRTNGMNVLLRIQFHPDIYILYALEANKACFYPNRSCGDATVKIYILSTKNFMSRLGFMSSQSGHFPQSQTGFIYKLGQFITDISKQDDFLQKISEYGSSVSGWNLIATNQRFVIHSLKNEHFTLRNPQDGHDPYDLSTSRSFLASVRYTLRYLLAKFSNLKILDQSSKVYEDITRGIEPQRDAQLILYSPEKATRFWFLAIFCRVSGLLEFEFSFFGMPSSMCQGIFRKYLRAFREPPAEFKRCFSMIRSDYFMNVVIPYNTGEKAPESLVLKSSRHHDLKIPVYPDIKIDSNVLPLFMMRKRVSYNAMTFEITAKALKLMLKIRAVDKMWMLFSKVYTFATNLNALPRPGTEGTDPTSYRKQTSSLQNVLYLRSTNVITNDIFMEPQNGVIMGESAESEGMEQREFFQRLCEYTEFNDSFIITSITTYYTLLGLLKVDRNYRDQYLSSFDKQPVRTREEGFGQNRGNELSFSNASILTIVPEEAVLEKEFVIFDLPESIEFEEAEKYEDALMFMFQVFVELFSVNDYVMINCKDSIIQQKDNRYGKCFAHPGKGFPIIVFAYPVTVPRYAIAVYFFAPRPANKSDVLRHQETHYPELTRAVRSVINPGRVDVRIEKPTVEQKNVCAALATEMEAKAYNLSLALSVYNNLRNNVFCSHENIKLLLGMCKGTMQKTIELREYFMHKNPCVHFDTTMFDTLFKLVPDCEENVFFYNKKGVESKTPIFVKMQLSDGENCMAPIRSIRDLEEIEPENVRMHLLSVTLLSFGFPEDKAHFEDVATKTFEAIAHVTARVMLYQESFYEVKKDNIYRIMELLDDVGAQKVSHDLNFFDTQKSIPLLYDEIQRSPKMNWTTKSNGYYEFKQLDQNGGHSWITCSVDAYSLTLRHYAFDQESKKLIDEILLELGTRMDIAQRSTNQLYLLSELYASEKREVSPLLYPPEKPEDLINGPYQTTIRGNKYSPGYFRCPVVRSFTMALHPRLTPDGVLSRLKHVCTMFSKDQIVNRANVFVGSSRLDETGHPTAPKEPREIYYYDVVPADNNSVCVHIYGFLTDEQADQAEHLISYHIRTGVETQFSETLFALFKKAGPSVFTTDDFDFVTAKHREDESATITIPLPFETDKELLLNRVYSHIRRSFASHRVDSHKFFVFVEGKKVSVAVVDVNIEDKDVVVNICTKGLSKIEDVVKKAETITINAIYDNEAGALLSNRAPSVDIHKYLTESHDKLRDTQVQSLIQEERVPTCMIPYIYVEICDTMKGMADCVREDVFVRNTSGNVHVKNADFMGVISSLSQDPVNRTNFEIQAFFLFAGKTEEWLDVPLYESDGEQYFFICLQFVLNSVRLMSFNLGQQKAAWLFSRAKELIESFGLYRNWAENQFSDALGLTQLIKTDYDAQLPTRIPKVCDQPAGSAARCFNMLETMMEANRAQRMCTLHRPRTPSTSDDDESSRNGFRLIHWSRAPWLFYETPQDCTALQQMFALNFDEYEAKPEYETLWEQWNEEQKESFLMCYSNYISSISLEDLRGIRSIQRSVSTVEETVEAEKQRVFPFILQGEIIKMVMWFTEGFVCGDVLSPGSVTIGASWESAEKMNHLISLLHVKSAVFDNVSRSVASFFELCAENSRLADALAVNVVSSFLRLGSLDHSDTAFKVKTFYDTPPQFARNDCVARHYALKLDPRSSVSGMLAYLNTISEKLFPKEKVISMPLKPSLLLLLSNETVAGVANEATPLFYDSKFYALVLPMRTEEAKEDTLDIVVYVLRISNTQGPVTTRPLEEQRAETECLAQVSQWIARRMEQVTEKFGILEVREALWASLRSSETQMTHSISGQDFLDLLSVCLVKNIADMGFAGVQKLMTYALPWESICRGLLANVFVQEGRLFGMTDETHAAILCPYDKDVFLHVAVLHGQKKVLLEVVVKTNASLDESVIEFLQSLEGESILETSVNEQERKANVDRFIELFVRAVLSHVLQSIPK